MSNCADQNDEPEISNDITKKHFPTLLIPTPVPVCSVPDWQRQNPHPRHGEPAYRHTIHRSGGTLPASRPHLLQPAGHAPLPDQRDPAAAPHSGCGAA